MAAKKAKLETKPIAEAKLPPAVDAAVARFELNSVSRAPSGRGIGHRLRLDGQSELVVIEGNKLRELPLKPAMYQQPDISSDGKRALVYMTEIEGRVLEITLDSGKSKVIWKGSGALFNIRSQNVQRVLYAGDEHMILQTAGKQALARRDKSGETVFLLGGLENTFRPEPLLGGRFAVFHGTSTTFLVAAKGDELHVVKKGSAKKDPLSVREGRLFIHDIAAKTWGEVTNLEAIWSAL